MKTFNPFESVVTIKLTCSCGNEIEESITDLPKPNYSADNVEDSENSTEYIITCPKCHKEYICNVYVNMYEGNIDIE